MIAEKIIKKMLRKWLKKRVYNDKFPLATNIARFEWVYNSPLKEWRDRIWIVSNHLTTLRESFDRYLKEYLYK